MFNFVCNICCALNTVASEADLDRERPSCLCGSSVRFRWIVHALSTGLFGHSLPLSEFPTAKAIRGIGLSDAALYAGPLADKLDFVNTRYDAEPFFDIANPACGAAESLDFIIASEVFEHIASPVQQAFDNLFRLIKPDGFVAFSTPWKPAGQTTEHFLDLHDWTLAKLRNEVVLVNRTSDGRLETFDQLCFHGGPGQTLEMRLFSRLDLEQNFRTAGFTRLEFAGACVARWGIIFSAPWSLPCTARK